jgi:hypothetical protein
MSDDELGFDSASYDHAIAACRLAQRDEPALPAYSSTGTLRANVG